MKKPWIIGHRGVAGLPENSLEGFERAIEMGVDGIELDVRMTGTDGKLVVLHGSVVGERSLKNSSYDQIRVTPEGQVVPLLEEVLEKIGKKTFLDIELKHDGCEEAATELIKKYCNPEKTMISGFDPKILETVHELLPELHLGFIFNRTQDEEQRHNAPVDVVIPQFRLASRELIEEIHEEGLRVWAWTVNEEAEIKRLLNLGVDGFITDYPDRVAAALGR
ncbi:MAG: glycerophosphodiester phosphodiesterase [Bryobacterales bacterium]